MARTQRLKSDILSVLMETYAGLKKTAQRDAKNADVAQMLIQLTTCAGKFLATRCGRVELISKVQNKKYFSFKQKRGNSKLSRPINRSLFDLNTMRNIEHFAAGSLIKLSPEDRLKLLYTMTLSFLAAIDVLKVGDQKSPATFFECLIGHLLSRAFGVNPRTQVEVLHLEDEASTLPTDFIFDLGSGKPKFHVPVKTSTRERVIQVFAHQRVLDGVHGFGAFKCVLVCLTETKLDHDRREVIEICLPKQWVLYQRFIAPVYRFYYFDVPVRYRELASLQPPLPVQPFSQFFEDIDLLAKA